MSLSIRYADLFCGIGGFRVEAEAVLDQENKRTHGDVERHIYLCFNERQETVAGMIAFIETTRPINWGRRVCSIVCESELLAWYECCLRGENAQNPFTIFSLKSPKKPAQRTASWY